MVKYIDILDFSFYHFEDGELKTQQIPKEFPLGVGALEWKPHFG